MGSMGIEPCDPTKLTYVCMYVVKNLYPFWTSPSTFRRSHMHGHMRHLSAEHSHKGKGQGNCVCFFEVLTPQLPPPAQLTGACSTGCRVISPNSPITHQSHVCVRPVTQFQYFNYISCSKLQLFQPQPHTERVVRQNEGYQ